MTRIYRDSGPSKKVKKGNPGEVPLINKGSDLDNGVAHQDERARMQGEKEVGSARKPGEGPGGGLQKEERRSQ